MNGRILVLLSLLCLMVSSVSAVTVTNSNDWKDVYSGMAYSYQQGEGEPYFVSSVSGTGLFKILPDTPLTLIESENSPKSPNLGARLSSRNYNIENRIEVENANLELQPEDSENFIVVSEDYPASAITAAPLAHQMDAWVLIVSEDNLDEVSSRLEDAEGETLMIGAFSNSVREEIQPLSDDRIISTNRINLSVRVAEEFKERSDEIENVRLASGLYLEESMFRGNMPVLLTGTNFLPDSVENYIRDNEVRNTYVLGNQLTSVGEDLNDNVENNSVFIKYGQGMGEELYALSMFQLPNSDLSLELSYSIYDPSSDKLYLGFENTGDSKLYELTSFTVTDNGEEIGSSGDDSAVFIGAGNRKTLNYQLDTGNTEFDGDEQIQLTTSYGPNSQALSAYLTNEGSFEPPYVENLSINRIQTNTNVTVEEIVFESSESQFKILLQNNGDRTAFVDTDLTGISVNGRNTSINGEVVSIAPNQQREIYLSSDLSNQDFSSQRQATLSVNYGPDENSMVNGYRRKVRIERSSGMFSSTSPQAMAGGIVLILIVSGLFYLNRKYDPERMNET